MSAPGLTTYDQVPYDARPRYATHPDCLATLATLLGMRPAPVDRCRVLELGCSTGGNLLPLAQSLPDSRFVGIDLSPTQIETGRKVAAALGLDNLRLEARSILDVEPSFGEFDYVVSHGVYSWVPEAVRDKLLSVCRHNLAPQGIAYVSYNTYPGWHLRAPVREMMNFHVRGLDDPAERVQQARAILEFMRRHNPEPGGTWARVLADEGGLLGSEGDYYVFHEHLEDENHPVYFHQFMEHARAHGLQFLGESELHTTLSALPQEAQEGLRRVSPDLVHLEQYLDFLTNRTFRRTLLVREEAALNRAPGPGVVEGLLVAGLSRPRSASPEVASTKVEEFENEKGSTFSTNIPIVKSALVGLYESWPRAFPFGELWEAARDRLGPGAMPPEQARALLARSLVQLYLSSLAGLHTYLPPFALAAGERPRTTPLARLQARTGAAVTNFRHRQVQPPVFDRSVLSLCDGGRDRAAIVEDLAGMVRRGEVGLARDGRPLTGEAETRRALAEELEESLARLARAMLLEA
jgi:methyltransferase-like protein/SAM-dependent methyltransferase